MTANRTVVEKVGDWKQAYDAIREELTPPQMRLMLGHLTAPTPMDGDDVAAVQAYVQVVRASLDLSRVITANDRAAAVTAAMLTQAGVSRPIFGDDAEA